MAKQDSAKLIEKPRDNPRDLIAALRAMNKRLEADLAQTLARNKALEDRGVEQAEYITKQEQRIAQLVTLLTT